MICKSCGQYVADGKSFCSNCGASCRAGDAEPFAGIGTDVSLGIDSIAQLSDSHDLLNYSFGLDLTPSSGVAQATGADSLNVDLVKGSLDLSDLGQPLAMPDLSGLELTASASLAGTQTLAIVSAEIPQASEFSQRAPGLALGTTVASAKGATATSASGTTAIFARGATGASAGAVNRKEPMQAPDARCEERRAPTIDKRFTALKNPSLGGLLAEALYKKDSLPLGEWLPTVESSSAELSEHYKDVKTLLDKMEILLQVDRDANRRLIDELEHQQQEAKALVLDIPNLVKSARSCCDTLRPLLQGASKGKVKASALAAAKTQLVQVVPMVVDILGRVQTINNWWDYNQKNLNELAAKILRAQLPNMPAGVSGDCKPLDLLLQMRSASNVEQVLLSPANISTYLVWSLTNTFACCPVLGLVALLFSVRCYHAKKSGQLALATKQSQYALECNFIGLILAIVFWVIMITLED